MIVTNGINLCVMSDGVKPSMSEKKEPLDHFDPQKVTSDYFSDSKEDFIRWAYQSPEDYGTPGNVATMDLHFFSCDEAPDVLQEFVSKLYLVGGNEAFILTGKGLHSVNGYSVLAANLPTWLEEISEESPFKVSIDDRREANHSANDRRRGYYIRLEKRLHSRKALAVAEGDPCHRRKNYGQKLIGNRYVNTRFTDFLCKKINGSSGSAALRGLWEIGLAD